MGNRTKQFQTITLSLLLLGLTGCIKEDIKECQPVENFIELSIKDMNYFNIDKISKINRMDENSPFNSFVQTLNYSLRNKMTGEVIKTDFLPMTEAQNTTHKLTFPGLPLGEYEFSVYGNTTNNTPSSNLHPDNKFYSDIYVSDTVFSIENNESMNIKLPMERSKGLLLIICENFPPSITKIEKQLTSIYKYIDTKKIYSDTTSVKEDTPLKSINQAYTAPTPTGIESNLRLRFLDETNTSLFNVPPLSIQTRRNEVTLVSVVYKPESNSYEVWSNLDGKWTKFHQLTFK